MRLAAKNCRGAFLLEALLAVFILSVSLVGLIRGLLLSLNASVEAERYAAATLTAENALLEVVRLNGQKLTGTVALDKADDKHSANIVVQPSGNDKIPAVLQEARLTVAWPGKLKEKKIEAVTLILGPADEKK